MPDLPWSRLADIVAEALDLPPADREAFLDAVCADADGALASALREEAAALIAAAESADATDALRSPMQGVVPLEARLPDRVGPWKIDGLLGEGGMGIVYRAARADGLFERAVAVKRIRPGLGRILAGRLEAERNVLARLDHPGIARLYDGAIDDDGVPYVVMELVDGVPITEFAEDADLTVEARVRLFLNVCDAVAYAHQNLVVHRDLKPSNVFVVAGDAAAPASVKLLDFGIAKLIGDEEADSFAMTLTRTQAAMTPSYAAPEQISRGAITTATDVYALGVMLFELLGGQRPYSLTDTTPAEAERIVCETVPPTLSAIAPLPRARALRGDLDTIVARALAKEPERRYASAETLAADLRRHLNGLPVEARPATVRYRVGRFVRRHSVGVAATVLIAVAVLGGAGAALWQARMARAEAAKATAVNDFLREMLAASRPDEEGRDIKVSTLLDRAAAGLDSGFTGQRGVEAAMRVTLGATYRELGLYPEAERQFVRALAIRERLYGPIHAEVADAQRNLGTMRQNEGQFQAADSLYQLALATHRRHQTTPYPDVSTVLADLGYLNYEQGNLDEAIAYYREGLAIEEAALPANHHEILLTLSNLAVALADKGESDEAGSLLERQIALYRQFYPDRKVNLGNALANLGSVRLDQGRRDEAATLQAEAVELFREAVGDDHPDTGFGLNNLGSTLGSLGRNAEAEPLLRESVAIYRSSLGATHPNVGFPLVNLGKALRDQGRPREAEAAFRQAADLFRLGFGEDNPVFARSLFALGSLLLDEGRVNEAEPVLREAHAIRVSNYPPDHPDRAETASALGDVFVRADRKAVGERLLRQSSAVLQATLGADNPRAINARDRLDRYLRSSG